MSLEFICKRCSARRRGSDQVVCGHLPADYTIADPIRKPEEKATSSQSFISPDPLDDLDEGDKKRFKELFG